MQTVDSFRGAFFDWSATNTPDGVTLELSCLDRAGTVVSQLCLDGIKRGDWRSARRALLSVQQLGEWPQTQHMRN